MAAGFEAKARITADVSSFVQASRNMARAAGTADAAVRQLREQLEALQRTSGTAASSMRPVANAARAARDAAQQSAQSIRDLQGGLRQSAQAFDASSSSADRYSSSTQKASNATKVTAASLRAMGRDMQRLNDQRNILLQIQSREQRLTEQQARALRTLDLQINSLEQQYTKLNREQRQVVDTSRALVQAQQTATSGLRSMNRFAQEAVQAERQLQREQEKAARAAEQQAAKAREAAQANDRMSSSMRDASRAAGRFDESLFSIRSVMTDLEDGFRTVQMAVQRAAVSMAANFSEQEMATAQLSRVTQETQTEVRELADQFRSMSEAIPVPFAELARIGTLGSQVGIANSAMVDFTETVALFSATTDVAEEEASLLFARITEMLGLDDSQIRNLGAAVSELGSNSAATEQEILTTTESIATVATQAGLSETTILGLGSAMASLRIRPELARGAVQRVFLQLEQAARGGAEGMEALMDVTGMTQTELQKLQEDNPDEFFLTVMSALSQTADAGENLIPVLREIGINNTRDADVVARLAGNYGLLTDQVDLANRSFAEGSFLHRESSRIFDTLTARVQVMRNTWSNAFFAMFEAIAPLLTELVEFATAVGEVVGNFAEANPTLTAFAIGLAGLVGILAAVGVAFSALARASIAAQQAMVAFGVSAATSATTASGAAVATSGLATAYSAAGAAAGRAAGATAAFIAAHPVGALVAFAAAVTALAIDFGELFQSTSEANEELLKSQEVHQQAAGGLEGLRTALEKDTQAWNDAQEAAKQYAMQEGLTADAAEAHAKGISDSFALRTQTTTEMSEAQQEHRKALAESAQAELEYERSVNGTIAGLKRRRSRMEGDTSAIDAAIARQERLTEEVRENRGEVEEQTVAVGLAAYEWQQASLRSAVLESGLLSNAEAMKIMGEAGVDLGDTLRNALALEAQEAGAGVELLNTQIARVRDEMGALERLWDSMGEGPGPLNFLGIDVRTEAEKTVESLEELRDNLEANTLAIEEAAAAGEIFADTTFQISNDASLTASEIQQLGIEQAELAGKTNASAQTIAEMGAAAAVMNMEIGGLGITVRDLSDAFAGFVDPVEAWRQAQEEANQAVIDADNGIDQLSENAKVNFDEFLNIMDTQVEAQQNWAANLLKVSTEVPPEVLAGLTEMGVEGADIVQGLADANDEQVDRFVEQWKAGGSTVLDDYAITFASFIQMANETGDTAGRDFALNLYEKYQEGSISWVELTDELTAYAEEEFQGADTTNEPGLISQPAIKAMNKLAKALENIKDDTDLEMEPELETGGWFSSVSSWYYDTLDWINSLRSQFRAVLNMMSGRSVFSGIGGRGSASFADGGWVRGEGGPRQDKIPAMLSDNEFVVNARSAREFGPLLEWINSGQNNAGSAPILSPNFVPDDIFEMPRRPLNDMATWLPEAVNRAATSTIPRVQDRIVMTINNQYPQAEPTSVTVNRALAFAGALDGLG